MTDDPDVAQRVTAIIRESKGYLKQIETFNNTETPEGRRLAANAAYALLRSAERIAIELDNKKEEN